MTDYAFPASVGLNGELQLGDPYNLAAGLMQRSGDRWLHIKAVGYKAERIAPYLRMSEDDQWKLIRAAWMHDLGYAFPQAHPWHPIAGALFLDVRGWHDIAPYVAWHSSAEHEADLLGFKEELLRWEQPHDSVKDALDWCDMTTGPDGTHLTIEGRWSEVGERHGRESNQYLAMGMSQERMLRIEAEFQTLIP